ncbi:MAG: PIG-L family deacetylase [Bacteroidetes bacterium]|nr:PIG-L family deacetylase [Bacteroidota bacterium]
MTGIRQLLAYLSMRKLRMRSTQIMRLVTNPHVTVYPREVDFTGEASRIVVLTPHADDETFGMGGTLLRHIAHGDQVEVLLFSDNVASIDDASISRTDKIECREKEFRCAMEILGVSRYQHFQIADQDFRSGRYPRNAFSSIIEKVPDVLYLPSVFDNHHDHRVLNVWLLRTLREHYFCRPLIRSYEVWSPLAANAVTDITGEMDRKREAMRCYASQLETIDYMHHMEGLNAYRAITFGGRRADFAEAFFELPADVYFEIGKSLFPS